MPDQKILRVVDANFNRCKEGLRVVEDIFRFVWQQDKLRKKARNIRHSLDSIAQNKNIRKAIKYRDAQKDHGRNIDNLETRRDSINDVLYINFQRSKEALRVLEEFFKLIDVSVVGKIKRIRYKIYSLEKDTFIHQS